MPLTKAAYFRRLTYFLVMAWAFALSGLQAVAAPRCEFIFTERFTKVPEAYLKSFLVPPLKVADGTNPGVAENPFPQLATSLKILTEALLIENSAFLGERGQPATKDFKNYQMTGFKITPGTELDKFPVITVTLKNKFDGKEINQFIRSNGQAAFLYKSWMYRDLARVQPFVKRFKSVYLENGEVKFADQGELLIASLPDNVKLSRTMGALEVEQWLTDGPLHIGNYGMKLHFAPEFFRFSKAEPFIFPYSKEQLLEAYRNGDVEINTYDRLDPKDIWKNNMEVEFEIVFSGEPALENLRPLLRETLRQKAK